MEARSEHETLRGNGTTGAAEGSIFETIANLQRDLNAVTDALALLGVRRCSQCKQFFSSTEPGALFDCGQLVCYGCVPDWWTTVSAKLSVPQREKLEGKISSWLRKYHGAEVVKEDKNAKSEIAPHQFQIVVHCTECGGSGKILEGERCRFCNGFGTVRVVANK